MAGRNWWQRGVRLALLLVWPLLAQPALAETRVALVIGNADYANATVLANPLNDARAVAARLSAAGYEVALHENLGGAAFRLALGEFSEAAGRADIALFFYAGHGIEMAGRNYLIPTDSVMRTESTAQFETVPLDQVLLAAGAARQVGIVMLDACRDNPFGASMARTGKTRSLARGLAPVSLDGMGGLVVSFAAEAGNTAADGEGKHSPYTQAFLEVLDQPELEVGRMLRNLRARVRELSEGRQVPVEQAQLPDHDVFLVSASAPAAPLPQPVAGPVAVANPQPAAAAATPEPTALFFDAVRQNDPARLSEFVRLYPDHPRAADALALIEQHEDQAMWQAVAGDGGEAALRRYLMIFPAGLHAAEAEARLQAIAASRTPPPAVSPPAVHAPPPAFPAPAFGAFQASFNCAAAQTTVEIAICSYGDLAQQDHRVAATYTSALATGRVTRAGQRQWLQLRDATCHGNGRPLFDCILTMTEARIAALAG